MFDTGVRQFRMAMGMVWGRRLNPRNIGRLVEDALATHRRVRRARRRRADTDRRPAGRPGRPAALRHHRRSAAPPGGSPSSRRSTRAGSPPPRSTSATLDLDALRDHPGDREGRPDPAADRLPVRRRAPAPGHPDHRHHRTPAEVWLSRYEMELWPALGALAAVLRDDLRPDRRHAGQHQLPGRPRRCNWTSPVCRLVGAGCRMLGLVPPDEALDSLADGGVDAAVHRPELPGRTGDRRPPARDWVRPTSGSAASTSAARCSSPSLAAAAGRDLRRTGHQRPVRDDRGAPGHRPHLQPGPSAPRRQHRAGRVPRPRHRRAGRARALATVVITPYFPYRECMPVFRYDTRDVVRRLPDEHADLRVSGLPATSRCSARPTSCCGSDRPTSSPRGSWSRPIEALPAEPWPARFRAGVGDGRIAPDAAGVRGRRPRRRRPPSALRRPRPRRRPGPGPRRRGRGRCGTALRPARNHLRRPSGADRSMT